MRSFGCGLAAGKEKKGIKRKGREEEKRERKKEKEKKGIFF